MSSCSGYKEVHFESETVNYNGWAKLSCIIFGRVKWCYSRANETSNHRALIYLQNETFEYKYFLNVELILNIHGLL